MNSRLLDSVSKYLPFVRKAPRPNSQQILKLRPVRNPSIEWERSPETNLVVLVLKQHPYKQWDKMIGKVFKIPTQRKIEMSDELSSLVWEMCDGATTVAAMASRIAQVYKLTARQAEVSVLAFLNTLQGKRLVGVPVDQAAEIKQGENKEPPKHLKGHKGFNATRKQRSNSRVARERGH